MDILIQLGIEPQAFLLSTLFGTFLVLLLYRRLALNLFDPLWFFILTTIGCNILVFTLPWDPTLRIEYVVFSLLFWCGFVLRGRTPIEAAPKQLELGDHEPLDLMLTLLFALLIISNLYVGVTSGFPLFTSVPDATKVTTYQNGLGIIRRINMMPFLFFISGCTVMIIRGYKRIKFVLMLSVGSALIAMTGAKSILLPVATIPGFAILHPGLIQGRAAFAARVKKYSVLVLIIATGLALLILVIDSHGGGIKAGVQLLASRLLMSGDVILYYFPSRGFNPNLRYLRPLDYLSYLFKGMLATLRIMKEYPPALGTVIMGIDQVGFGPNPLYFVRGDIFFGPIGGCFYCFAIGYCVSWLRRGFFTAKQVSIGSLTLRLTFATSAFALASDSGLFVGGAVDLLVVGGTLWLLASLCVRATRGFAIELPSRL